MNVLKQIYHGLFRRRLDMEVVFKSGAIVRYPVETFTVTRGVGGITQLEWTSTALGARRPKDIVLSEVAAVNVIRR